MGHRAGSEPVRVAHVTRPDHHSVVWGIGMALREATLIDHRFGRIMNANIAEYHVTINANVQDIKVVFVDEPDHVTGLA
jgi:CO/xanthine dehydrogenase Mo-binding subunit